MRRFRVARVSAEKCVNCGFCEMAVCEAGSAFRCRTAATTGVGCTGCGACVLACPYEARFLEDVQEERAEIKIKVNGERFAVHAGITVLDALEMLGFKILPFKEEPPSEMEILAPCRTGGCWACAVIVDGDLKPSCVTPVREGMEISTDVDEIEPKRIVSGFHGHPVGGVGTPYWVKPVLSPLFYAPVEVACFAHGCNLRCPTCQNWSITYSASVAGHSPLKPEEAARIITFERRMNRVNRIAISGGECTLNRRWLLSFLEAVKRMNRDKNARFHVDTNGTFLTRAYIDDLVDVGMTDIGVDVKALHLETFMRITGLREKSLASCFLKNEWDALEYLIDRHAEHAFVGVGIPYNASLISLEEVREIGERIASISEDVQVCALDYRPEFRRRDIVKPSYEEMLVVKKTLEECGLHCVLAQTELGRIGP